MGFSRQEYWSGLPFLSPGDLPDPGIKPGFPTLQADALPSEPLGKPNSSHGHTNISAIYRATIDETDQKTSRKKKIICKENIKKNPQ